MVKPCVREVLRAADERERREGQLAPRERRHAARQLPLDGVLHPRREAVDDRGGAVRARHAPQRRAERRGRDESEGTSDGETCARGGMTHGAW
eukprot:3361012-Prymnesium_polylepis.1